MMPGTGRRAPATSVLGAPATPSGQVAAASVSDLTKSYGATQALDRASFEVKAGQIHALLGGNGSGKSTAIKLLAGIVPADGGTVRINDEVLDARSMDPRRARTLGLRFVHQQSTVFNELTVAENLAMGFEFPRGPLGQIRWREVRRRAQLALDRFEIDIDAGRPASTLGPAGQAMLAIARALQDLDDLGRGILILDEPTAALPPSEVSTLLSAMRQYAARGLGVLFVTHRIDEVLEVATAATILRDGRVAGALKKDELSRDSLVAGIVGATIDESRWKPERTQSNKDTDGAKLEVRELVGGPVTGASFEVGKGEVVGIAGLLGSGRSSLLRMLFGAVRPDGGEVVLDGEAIRVSDSKQAVDKGIAYVPEDRAQDGLFAQLTVTENMSIGVTRQYWRNGFLRLRRERADTTALMEKFKVRAAGESASIGSLSGGNQQKVVLARWLRMPLQVLLLDEPTQGVDVGARAEIFAAIAEAATEGTAVVLVSSEFEELSMICDRVLVMHRGKIVREVSDPSVDGLELDRIVNEGASIER